MDTATEMRRLKGDLRELRGELDAIRQLMDVRPARYALPGGGGDAGGPAQTGVLAFGGMSVRGTYREITRDTLLFHPPTDTWLFQMDMLNPGRWNMAAASVGSVGLSFGGRHSGGGLSNWTDRFLRSAWAARSDIPFITSGRFHWAAASIGGDAYTSGGQVSDTGEMRTTVRYRYALDSYIQLDDMPNDVSEHAAFVADGQFYASGGTREGRSLRETSVFDPVSRTWAAAGTVDIMEHPRAGLVAAALGGYGHVFGGSEASNLFWRETERYDHVANTWSIKAKHPAPPRVSHEGAAFGGRAYIIGGEDLGGGLINDNDEYDPDTDTWEARADFPGQPRRGHGVAAI